MKKIIVSVLAVLMAVSLSACGEPSGSRQDIYTTQENANNIQENQPTPTDLEYSLERYNLIRRAYWVNGQREKALSLPCEIDRPLGYIVLFTEGGGVVGRYVVDGKVTSLNSYLTPDSEYYEQEYYNGGSSVGDGNSWLADVDGSYGENDSGIFFFNPDGKYIEWTGTYIYSDTPFIVEDPILKVQEEN